MAACHSYSTALLSPDHALHSMLNVSSIGPQYVQYPQTGHSPVGLAYILTVPFPYHLLAAHSDGYSERRANCCPFSVTPALVQSRDCCRAALP
jgi:hypothetical protein